MTMNARPLEIEVLLRPFEIEGRIVGSGVFGSGHINDTLLIRTRDEDPYDYLLQRINHHIFKNVAELQENIERVTTHIRRKLAAVPGADPDREVLTLVRCRDGTTYSRDAEGGYWRVYLFIDGTRSYDIVDSPARATEGGRAFGRFQAMLSDLPGPPLHDTIPRFHDIDYRVDNFADALRRDPLNRAAAVRDEIAFVERRADEMRTIKRLGAEGKIPLRITHNDTKFNNVLLDANDRALCVTDLDTVMNGYVHYDFGDSIRTSTNTGAEDEADLSKVSMDIRLFEAYARGFLEETGGCLNSVEIDHLAFSGRLLTYIIGLRFFTDHLDGDHYFKIHVEGHNLRRARAQFKLLRSMEEQADATQAVIARLRK
jgi:Ser/Thr protein kinase RdoA (MazF antagonist)